jgi:hypothetical protein
MLETMYKLALNFVAVLSGALALLSAQTLYTEAQHLSVSPTVTSTPVLAAFDPQGGSSMVQRFLVKYENVISTGGLQYVQVLFNTALSGVNACYVIYYGSTQPGLVNETGFAGLVNDSGIGFVGTLTPGSNRTLENSQCTLRGEDLKIWDNGYIVLLTLEFKPSFTGAKAAYTRAMDMANMDGGWVHARDWLVSRSPGSPPSIVSVIPEYGPATVQTFSILDTHDDGVDKLTSAELLLSAHRPSTDLTNTCHLTFNISGRQVSLTNDAGTATVGSIALGSNQAVENSKCILYGLYSSATAAVNNQTITLKAAVRFKPSADGYYGVSSRANAIGGLTSGWKPTGSFYVASGNTDASPGFRSAEPASGHGSAQIFSVTAYDANGNHTLTSVQLLINTPQTGVGGCYLIYSPQSGVISLIDDSGYKVQGSLMPRIVGTVENSACTLDGATSSATFSPSSDDVTLVFGIRFKPGFSGSKGTFVYVTDISGNVFPARLGSWNVE